MLPATIRAYAVTGTAILVAGMLPATAAPAASKAPVANLSLAELEERLVAVDAELAQLAGYSLRRGVGAGGYRSVSHPDAHAVEWIQIELGGARLIDQVVLVPMIWRDPDAGYKADGFPLEFRVLAGTGKVGDGRVVASFTAEDGLLPRIAPVVVPCPGTTASWVRIEASVLTPRVWDGKHFLQLSEILVFDGPENVALRMPVRTSSRRFVDKAWNQENLVNGFVPYLVDAARGERSLAFVSTPGIGDEPALSIDLGSSHPVDRIHLHRTDLSDTIPQVTPSDFGIPRRLVVDGANQAEFSDAVRLVEFGADSPFEVGPIMMRRFPETPCRYLRLTAVEPYLRPEGTTDSGKSQIGFAEVEIFAEGRNVALGRPVSASFGGWSPRRSLSALTDGRNFHGEILSVRDWLNELARRHELEIERPVIRAELDDRYARQKANLTRLGWLAALLAAGIAFTILVNRILRMRHVAGVKERLAADLHDELGANLHTIGLLSDLAAKAKDAPEKLGELHRRIRSETERSCIAVRHCADLLEANGGHGSLEEDMQRAARRIMAKLEHEIAVEGEDHLKRLRPRTRQDLFLFYKECLVNISRHADATEFKSHLSADDKEVRLTVSDNGSGLPDADGFPNPDSLQRRARLLGAKVTSGRSPEGGTRITLKLRTRKWGARK